MRLILSYVDPGSGFVFLQNIPFLWGIILGLSGLFAVFFKFFYNFIKKFFWVCFILLVALIIGGIIMHRPETGNKVIILGIDAMDPRIAEQLMQEGKLPHLSNLRTTGAYSRLATSNPSESVVAWKGFVTGLNPG